MELCSRPKQNHVSELIDGLASLHRLHIIHGDIKAENIMWSEKYSKNVLLDFGLSRFISENIG